MTGTGLGSALTIDGTNADNAINQSGDVVTIDANTPITFSTYPTVTINGLAGDDTFNVYPTTFIGVTTFNVNGGDPTASDKLIVNGTAGTDAFNYTTSDT